MAKDFNNQQVVDGYDQHIRKLIPGYEVVHLQILAILKAHLHTHANILIIGAGTGYELGYLLQQFPQCRFTVTELSTAMLKKAKNYVAPWNLDERVHFILGQHTELINQPKFDAVLSILVTHFVPFNQKQSFLHSAQQCLSATGIFLTFDLMQFESVSQSNGLKQICELNGLSKQQTQAMLSRMQDDFFPLTEIQTRNSLQQAGFGHVERFCQILTYQGYIARLKTE